MKNYDLLHKRSREDLNFFLDENELNNELYKVLLGLELHVNLTYTNLFRESYTLARKITKDPTPEVTYTEERKPYDYDYQFNDNYDSDIIEMMTYTLLSLRDYNIEEVQRYLIVAQKELMKISELSPFFELIRKWKELYRSSHSDFSFPSPEELGMKPSHTTSLDAMYINGRFPCKQETSDLERKVSELEAELAEVRKSLTVEEEAHRKLQNKVSETLNQSTNEEEEREEEEVDNGRIAKKVVVKLMLMLLKEWDIREGRAYNQSLAKLLGLVTGFSSNAIRGLLSKTTIQLKKYNEKDVATINELLEKMNTDRRVE